MNAPNMNDNTVHHVGNAHTPRMQRDFMQIFLINISLTVWIQANKSLYPTGRRFIHGDQKVLVSTYKKEGLVDFIKTLKNEFNVELLSTGGTARLFAIERDPSSRGLAYTGFPELFDGRIKTLHPRIEGGILFRRDNEKDREDAKVNGIERST